MFLRLMLAAKISNYGTILKIDKFLTKRSFALYYLLLLNMQWTYSNLQNWDDSVGNIPDVISLDISNRDLIELSYKIFKLTSLQEFYCANNQLTTLPKEIGQLTSLHTFYCYNNPLNNIKVELNSNNLQAVKKYLNRPSISLVDACKGFIMQEAFHFVYE